MLTRRLGNSDLDITVLGLGAWALGLVASGMGTITQAQSLADQVWAAQEVSRLRKQTLSKCVAYSCPGSMRMTEYGKVLNAVDAITYVPTQVGILRLLIAGRVHATNNPIQGAHGITEWGTADIVITRNYQNRRESVFNRTRGELAYVLAHEYHHNRALEGTTRAWREGNRHLYQPNDGATSPWEAAFESAADAFACTVTDAGSRGRFEHGCAP